MACRCMDSTLEFETQHGRHNETPLQLACDYQTFLTVWNDSDNLVVTPGMLID